jgi:hypothetical protein
MKALLAAAAIAMSLAPVPASAQERVGDAALGGLSGALVFGPVGAVAGIIVGYTAGPSIGRSWGLNRNTRHPDRTAQRRPAARATADATNQIQGTSASPARLAADAKPAWDTPPVAGFE